MKKLSAMHRQREVKNIIALKFSSVTSEFFATTWRDENKLNQLLKVLFTYKLMSRYKKESGNKGEVCFGFFPHQISEKF